MVPRHPMLIPHKKKEVSPPNIETIPFPLSHSSFLSQKITLSRYLLYRCVIQSSINRDKGSSVWWQQQERGDFRSEVAFLHHPWQRVYRASQLSAAYRRESPRGDDATLFSADHVHHPRGYAVRWQRCSRAREVRSQAQRGNATARANNTTLVGERVCIERTLEACSRFWWEWVV